MPNYSGKWKLPTVMQAEGAGNWPKPPYRGGELWLWGSATYGRLGLGNTTTYSSPVQVGALTNWLEPSAGVYSTLALGDTLWAWGRNTKGQLGDGTTTVRSSPVQVGALTTWAQISSAPYQSSYAVKTDGTLWVWGFNHKGQLGVGNTTDYSSPVQVGALTD